MNKKLSTKQLNNLTTDNLSNDVVLSVKNVSKKFCKNLRRSMAYGIIDLAKNLVGVKPDSTNLKKDEFWALQNINFEMRRGEVLGLIGANGSGKTTLLRLLAGIFPPDKGNIAVKGRVGALIALGAGFHPHMTGRENIYLNGSILGMTRKEIDSNIEYISVFAGIGDFLEAPVSTYSSGMRVRLGFSVAAFLNPDILLVDEVLAVGDLSFRRKCLRHLKNYLESGGACVFVSHDMHTVQSFCSRCLLLNHGEVKFNGDTTKAVNRYLETLNSYEGELDSERHFRLNQDNPVMIEKMELSPLYGDDIRTGDDVKVTLYYRSVKYIKAVEWVLSFWTGDQWIRISTAGSRFSGVTYPITKGRGHLICILPKIKLAVGTYAVKSDIQDLETRLPLAWIGYNDAPAYFTVKGTGSELDNRHLTNRDLVVMDVEWER